MIYECPSGHVCFSKGELNNCAMRGCIKQTIALSPTDIN